jgi:hypothetical protein
VTVKKCRQLSSQVLILSKVELYTWNCVGKEIVSNEKLCQIQEEIDSLNENLEIGRR